MYATPLPRPGSRELRQDDAWQGAWRTEGGARAGPAPPPLPVTVFQVPHSHLLPRLLMEGCGLKPLFDAASSSEWEKLVPQLQATPFALAKQLAAFAPFFNPHYLPRRDAKTRSIWCPAEAELRVERKGPLRRPRTAPHRSARRLAGLGPLPPTPGRRLRSLEARGGRRGAPQLAPPRGETTSAPFGRQDELLGLGLERYGLARTDLVRALLLSCKSSSQIQHRITNMSRRLSADNPIKRARLRLENEGQLVENAVCPA